MRSEQATILASIMGLRVVAMVESLLLLATIVILDLITGSGDRFFHLNPHPFWIVVLLISAQYGALEGIIAALLSSAALLIGNLPPLGFGEDPYNYVVNLAINPAMWLVAALAIGELRSQADRRTQGLLDNLADAHERETRLIAAAEKLAGANKALEERVAGQLRTVASLYEASRAVEQLGTGDVLVGIAELVRAGLNPHKFSLFLLNQQQLESVLSEGWSANDRFTRVFASGSLLFREIVANQKFLCVASQSDQIVLSGEGMLAGPICSAETGETLGMLKIERMDAMEFNMTAVESFRVLCQWIGTAFARARTFEHASSRSFVGAGGILSASAEQPLTHFLKSLANRARFDLSAINLNIQIPDSVAPDVRAQIFQAVRQSLAVTIRQTDIVCERGSRGTEYVVLAPCCPHAEARRVGEKLRSTIAQALPQGLGVRLSVITVPLQELAAVGATA